MITATRPIRLASLRIAALTVAAWVPQPAPAQQPANTGNALDANLQVGSGGANNPVGQVDYRARNDIITGNVAGGRAFQGTVNYSAPGEFRGNLGSNSLFDFRASSLGSSPLISNSARQAAYGLRSRGQEAVTVYRGFSDINNPPTILGGGNVPVALDGGSRGIFEGSRVRTTTEISAFLGGSTRPVTADTLGEATPTGIGAPTGFQTPVITATPLLGIRQAPPQQPLPQQGRDASQETDPLLITPPAPQKLPGGKLEDQERLNVTDPNLSSVSRVQPHRVGQQAGSVNTQPSAGPGGAPPGLIIGQQLQSASLPQRAGETLDQRVARLQSMIFRQTNPAVARPGNEVYSSLIQQMQEQPKQEQAQKPKQRPLDAGLEAPDAQKIQQAESAAEAALERAYKIYGRPGEAPADPDAAADDAPDAELGAMQALLEQLRTDLPRVESLAAEAEDRTNQLMKMAEQRMADGKYFDAEALFRQARHNSPQNPMALVGLIHAQMGAGLIRSASFNLHRLFQNHPELINVRYQGKLLPPEQRLQWLQGELQRMIDSQEYTGEPGLMLAYLGHQTDSRQLVRYGLAIAEARNPRDPLLKVVRGIWLDSEDGEPRPQPDGK